MLKMRSECVKVSSMLFDSCVNCTRQGADEREKPYKKLAKSYKLPRSAAQSLHACEASTFLP
jgi:hypothetical protein